MYGVKKWKPKKEKHMCVSGTNSYLYCYSLIIFSSCFDVAGTHNL